VEDINQSLDFGWIYIKDIDNQLRNHVSPLCVIIIIIIIIISSSSSSSSSSIIIYNTLYPTLSLPT